VTTYTGLKQSFTPGAPPSDSTQYVFGLSFKVTSSGVTFDGWWWYCDIASGQSSAAEDFALWTVTGAGTGTYVTSSKVTSGTFSQGWNFVAAPAGISLTSGQEYRAVKTTNKSGAGSITYCHTANFFSTGSGSSGGVSGPLTVFSAPGNATNPEPSGDGQMVFTNPAADVTANYPNANFQQSWYGLDVQVSSSGATVSGDASLTAPGSLTAGAVDTVPAVLALTAPGVLTAPAFDTVLAQTALTAPGSLSAGALDTVFAAGALSASPSLTAGALGIVLAQVALASAPALAAPGLDTVLAQALLSSSPALTSSAFATAMAQAALSGSPSLLASVIQEVAAGPSLDDLWAIFIAASNAAQAAWRSWRMMRSVARTDGTAGQLYQQAYLKQEAADLAYRTWLAAHQATYPGVRG
jgi:hypothetical protein